MTWFNKKKKEEKEVPEETKKQDSKDIERFDAFIDFYHRQVINLPEPLLNKITEITTLYELRQYKQSEALKFYLIRPTLNKNTWVSFTYSDILWWKKSFQDRSVADFRDLERIENDFNMFYLRIIEVEDPDLRNQYPEVEEFYWKLKEYVSSHNGHLNEVGKN